MAKRLERNKRKQNEGSLDNMDDLSESDDEETDGDNLSSYNSNQSNESPQLSHSDVVPNGKSDVVPNGKSAQTNGGGCEDNNNNSDPPNLCGLDATLQVQLDAVDSAKIVYRIEQLSLDDFEMQQMKSPVLSKTMPMLPTVNGNHQPDSIKMPDHCDCCQCRCSCHIRKSTYADSCTQTLSTGDVVITKVYFQEPQNGQLN